MREFSRSSKLISMLVSEVDSGARLFLFVVPSSNSYEAKGNCKMSLGSAVRNHQRKGVNRPKLISAYDGFVLGKTTGILSLTLESITRDISHASSTDVTTTLQDAN